MFSKQQLVRTALSILAGLPPITATAREPVRPVVPLTPRLDHWDDHWFWWLPRHPVYESIEVAARDPDTAGHRDVWVWLTERAGVKRQLHYRNTPDELSDPAAVLRQFEVAVTGEKDAPRSIRISFTDPQGVPIALSMDVTYSLQRGSGLTSQSGHAAADLFLLFLRRQQTLGARGEASIGGTNYAFDAKEPLTGQRFRWAYSRDIEIGAVPFAKTQQRFGGDGFKPVTGAENRYARANGRRGAVTLSTDADGGLLTYAYQSGPRALTIRFDPALPTCTKAGAVTRSTFRIDMPGLPDAVKGDVDVRCEQTGASYAWRPSYPAWATRHAFSSTFRRQAGNRFEVSTTGPDASSAAPGLDVTPRS